jgi:hypothetical protein
MKYLEKYEIQKLCLGKLKLWLMRENEYTLKVKYIEQYLRLYDVKVEEPYDMCSITYTGS